MLPTLAFAGLLLAPYWIAVSMPRRLPLFVFVAAAGVALVGLYQAAGSWFAVGSETTGYARVGIYMAGLYLLLGLLGRLTTMSLAALGWGLGKIRLIHFIVFLLPLIGLMLPIWK